MRNGELRSNGKREGLEAKFKMKRMLENTKALGTKLVH